MVASLAIAAWGISDGLPVGLWAFVVSAGNVIVLLALEQHVPRTPGVSMFRDSQTPNDVAHGVLVAGVARTVAGPIAAGVVVAVAFVVPLRHGWLSWPGHWPLLAQVLLGLFIYSLGSYWTHRWCHRVGWLWRFHSLHHDVPQMHVLKGNRIHVGEDVIRQSLILVPLYALGVPGLVLVWIALWNNFEGALGHANIDFAFPGWAHWVLPTPADHLVHHGLDRDLQNANYHGITPLWDVLFGTFRHPDRTPVTALGIEDPLPRGFVAQLRVPLHVRAS
jgi:sterol desaturase/sphingolipid hydroxylase (fatty acid hydroxylase superfamily)